MIAVDAESRSIYVLELKDARSAHDGRTVRSQFLNRAKYEGQLARKCAYVSRHADEIAGHILGLPQSEQVADGWTVRGCFVVSVAAAWQYVVGWEERTAVFLESELSAQALRSLPAFSIPVDA